ncbi:hypothetical protein ANCDUO_07558 [Ancylostoma duodenale]|uniref:SCP domain-containing protein n=1 Tax=Ancylostoma duodenale TaxID=51022 RepID=A0A0C2DI67_9BILA|nr:hypothetical protein ANCDUO_07558 [Ancylostoma duodenale]
MTDTLRNQALNMHNYYRRLLASGWAKDGKIMYAKPSKAMPALAIKQWWAPLETTGIEDNLYTSTVEGSALETYVPRAHHQTTKVGCGVHRCDKIGKTLVQCAYDGAPTTADGDIIYPAGKPCSKCKTLAGTPNCSPLGALCVA